MAAAAAFTDIQSRVRQDHLTGRILTHGTAFTPYLWIRNHFPSRTRSDGSKGEAVYRIRLVAHI